MAPSGRIRELGIILLLGCAMALGTAPGLATAAGACGHLDKMTKAELTAAQDAGARIVLAFGADWCPTCSRQGALLTRLANELPECGLLLVHLDYDENKELARSVGVREQGTLVGLHGSQEVARLVGVSDMASIRAFLDKVRE